jgi:unsaturated rhamnogalacturonyl hydrolase
VTVGEQGTVELNGICASAGLGGEPYRDGSYEYYVGERVATNDLHGTGAFRLAALEMESAALHASGVQHPSDAARGAVPAS